MCYHNSLTAEAQELENRYNAEMLEEDDWEPIYHANAFAYLKWPIVTEEKPEQIQLYNWGLIPQWTKSKADGLKFRLNTLNARSETIFEKPSFRSSISRKRCLIPSTGFYEWRDFEKKKYPYFITLKNGGIFSMAGIYENWVDKETGEILNTFSIVTAEANPLMAKIHNSKKRMPVILSQETERLWLDPALDKEGIGMLMKSYDENEMTAHTISKLITSRTENSNVKDVMKEKVYAELD